MSVSVLTNSTRDSKSFVFHSSLESLYVKNDLFTASVNFDSSSLETTETPIDEPWLADLITTGNENFFLMDSNIFPGLVFPNHSALCIDVASGTWKPACNIIFF